jgi:hypothetical protein
MPCTASVGIAAIVDAKHLDVRGFAVQSEDCAPSADP